MASRWPSRTAVTTPGHARTPASSTRLVHVTYLRETSDRTSATRARGDQSPASEHRHAVGQRLGLLQVVRRQHDRAALATRARTVCHSTSRASTSSPTVGSSRNSSCGRPHTAIANCTWRFCPPESLPYGRCASAVEPRERQRLVHGQRVGVVAGASGDSSRTRSSGVRATSCIITPTRVSRRHRPASAPNRRAVP